MGCYCTAEKSRNISSREWLTRDLVGEWLKPGRHTRLAGAGEIGVNPDQRIHEDARRLTELSADLGIGLLQALVLLLCFLGVLWTVAGELRISIFGASLPIPGYMVWCALLYAASGSWLTWRVGRPLVGLNSLRSQREAELRFALIRAGQGRPPAGFVTRRGRSDGSGSLLEGFGG